MDNIGQQVLSLLVFMILARLLDPALFGIFAASLVFVFILRDGLLVGVRSALVTAPNADAIEFDTAFWVFVIISVFLFFIINLSAPLVERAYQTEGIASALHATSVLLLFAGFGFTHVAYVRLHYRFKTLALCHLAGVGAGGAAGITLALMGSGLQALIVNQVVMALTSTLLLWLVLPWRPSVRFSRLRSKRLLSSALPLSGAQTLQFAAQNFDTALVTYFAGPYSGGLYAASKRILQAAYLAIWQPIGTVALTTITKLRDDRAALARVVIKIAGMAAAVTFPVFALLGAVSTELLSILFGSKWLAAAPILMVLAAFGLVLPSMGVLHQLLIAIGRSRPVLVLTGLQAFLALGTVAIVRPSDGVTFAYCLGVPGVVSYLLTILVVVRCLPLPLGQYILVIARPLGCAVLMVWAVNEFPAIFPGAMASMIVKTVAGVSIYCLLVLLFARDILADVLSVARSLAPKNRLEVGKS